MIRKLAALPWTCVAAARVALYRNGLLRTHDLPRPAVSVGALEMGGTGKTPTTLAIATALRDGGVRPAIVSRGFGRVGTAPLLVCDGTGPLVTATEAGDEPWLMAHLMPEVAVAVAGPRELAAALVAPDGVDVFVLDDAFQHVRVRRRVDLLMVDSRRPFWTQVPPPFGRLRESVAAAARADAFVIRGDGGVLGDRWPAKPRLQLCQAKTHFLPLWAWLRDPHAEGVAPPGTPCVAFAGIAKPARFFNDMRKAGIEITLAQQYRDHQTYTTTEIRGLAERARLRGCDTLLTTEKDAARLAHLDLDDLNIVVATYRLRLEDEEPLLRMLEGPPEMKR